ncbi:TMV resistance protein N-like [Trifolium medium]|uniref:ADP-ribosyl cyclase/cyclic ADP-ribose hydrolase n=1 Tax=Trifolium medium TaxID=97028 RepID=A0A392NE28_9FABA|nr:TMV resistance protein N-like [Trifolium medium]
MLLGQSSSSNSSNISSRWIYHVFLSFRGEDTRLDFTDYIYAALVRKGIITFRDDKQLEKGDEIAVELFKAIERSLSAFFRCSMVLVLMMFLIREIVLLWLLKNMQGDMMERGCEDGGIL